MFPRVNNPWNVEYTAGGSSGGSAAAVAAGLSP
ncbi:MAG TPA: amidase family protein [Allocoleopsis sp.]